MENFEKLKDEESLIEFLDFIMSLSRLLIECGCSSNRLETLIETLGVSWDIRVEVMALPTGVWISAKKGHKKAIDLVRIRNWSVDLDRLARLNSLVESISGRKISIAEAHDALVTEHSAKQPYSTGITLLAGAGASSSLMYFYQGSTLEIILAFPIGAVLQILQKYIFIGENRRYLSDFLSAAFATIYALFFNYYYPSVDVPRLIIAGIIVIVPGLVLTNAVHELAQKNLVSGAAKMLEAVMITGALTMGVVFVLGLAKLGF